MVLPPIHIPVLLALASAQPAQNECRPILSAAVSYTIAHPQNPGDGTYLVVVSSSATLQNPEENTIIQRECARRFRQPKLGSALLKRNQVGSTLVDFLEPDFKAVPQETIDRIFEGEGWWTDFFRKFPGSLGYLQLSLPVVSQDGRTALLYAGQSCGGRCGASWILKLRKSNGAWQVVARRYLIVN